MTVRYLKSIKTVQGMYPSPAFLAETASAPRLRGAYPPPQNPVMEGSTAAALNHPAIRPHHPAHSLYAKNQTQGGHNQVHLGIELEKKNNYLIHGEIDVVNFTHCVIKFYKFQCIPPWVKT